MMARIRPLVPEEGVSQEEYGQKRLAKVFMSLSRQGEVCKRKMSASEEGTLALWNNFVTSRCAGVPWVGSPWAWNPLLVSEQRKVKRAYAALQALPASGPSVESSTKRRLQLEESLRSVRARIEDANNPGRTSASSSLAAAVSLVPSATPLTVTSSGSSLPGASPQAAPGEDEPPAATRGGKNPWKKRRSEFVSVLSTKYPNFEMDPTLDEAGWLSTVKGKDTRITGTCRLCNSPNSATIAHITGNQGLPKCKGRCFQETALQEDQAEADSDVTESRPRDDSNDIIEEEERPKLTHRSDFEAVMSFMETYHPHARLRSDLMTREGWEASITCQTSLILVTCTLCRSSRGASCQNILYNGQGFCQPCALLQTGYKKAIAVLGGLVRISNPHMRPQGSGNGQRYCHVDVECMVKGCGWKATLCTKSYTGILKKNPNAKIVPCKRCNKVEPWSTLEGFYNFQKILDYYQDTRFYKPVLGVEDWVQKVKNHNSKVPIQCAICDEIREVRLSSIQQGGSVGCGCFRSSHALEAELAKLLPSVHIQREVKVKGGLALDFAYFFDVDAEESRTQYQQACQDLDVTPVERQVKIGIELDGRQHFSWIIFSEPNEQIGLRDYNKDIAACESETTLIRLKQTSVWNNASHWKDFLRAALVYACSVPGGRIICEDSPDYTTSSNYASLRSSGPLSKLVRSEKLSHGVIRELHP